ncbi:MAG TPA: zinc-ribbon domain containing protein [Clostridia bacterium]|jgi:CxxC-x17-CxxC domain-containing protein|nr:zinc-ribbon domain containing protein [Clostridia bacterium]
MYQDKTLNCRECGRDFIFSASEQEFYAEKGFENEPARCPECRAARKAAHRGGRGYGRDRQMYQAVCAKCGKMAEVPFKPTSDRPVYCKDCYSKRNNY